MLVTVLQNQVALGHKLDAILQEMKRMTAAMQALTDQIAKSVGSDAAAALKIKDLEAKLATATAAAEDPAALDALTKQLADSQTALDATA